MGLVLHFQSAYARIADLGGAAQRAAGDMCGCPCQLAYAERLVVVAIGALCVPWPLGHAVRAAAGARAL